MKKNNQNPLHKNTNEIKEPSVFDDEGWLQLTPRESDTPKSQPFSSSKTLYDGGPKLIVDVNHFPLILCPFSPSPTG